MEGSGMAWALVEAARRVSGSRSGPGQERRLCVCRPSSGMM